MGARDLALHNICGWENPILETVYGVEVEVEFNDSLRHSYAIDHKPPNTRLAADGSLRHYAMEFVTRRPKPLEETKNWFKALVERSRLDKAIHNSPRTSIHVHVNIQHKTTNDIISMIQSWMLAEQGFLRFCGETRQQNNFCLPLCSNTGLTSKLHNLSLISYHHFYNMIRGLAVKYMALGIYRLRDLGTIEARSLRFTSDVDLFNKWLDMLHYWSSAPPLPINPNDPYEHIEFSPVAHHARECLKILGVKQDININGLIDSFNEYKLHQLFEGNV